MYIPHVQPLVYVGVLLMVTLVVVDGVIGGAIGSPEYHWRMVLCMRTATLGGCRFCGS